MLYTTINTIVCNVFFFKQKTAYEMRISDWSSDVCSSDLNAIAIVQIQERNRLRLFLRFDPYRRFCYCLVYVPRDSYSTETRLKIQQVLQERLEASDCEFSPYFSESVLTRVQFILRLDPRRALQVDTVRLAQEGLEACRTWQDGYHERKRVVLGKS